MTPLTVLSWLWFHPDARSQYEARHVNLLRHMIARHYPRPHRFCCVTDMPAGLDAEVDVIPAWNDFATVISPHGKRNPSCYRRLRMFHPDAAQWFGERFVAIDLDVVITGDLSPLWDRPDDFVMCGETNPTSFYNGSMLLLRAGARPRVWTDFDPQVSPDQSKRAGRFGSDQGWISYCLGPKEAKWTKADGLYSYRNDLHAHKERRLPPDARIVNFHGQHKPWHTDVHARYPWILAHYTEREPLAVSA